MSTLSSRLMPRCATVAVPSHVVVVIAAAALLPPSTLSIEYALTGATANADLHPSDGSRSLQLSLLLFRSSTRCCARQLFDGMSRRILSLQELHLDWIQLLPCRRLHPTH